MTERYILVTDDEYCYTLDTLAENYKTLEDFEKIEFEQAEKDGVDIKEYEDAILESAYDKYWDWVYNSHIEAETVNDILNMSYDEIKDLKDKITEIIQDEHQLSLSFLEYKKKVTETLQKQHDKLLQRKRKLSKAIDMQNHHISIQLLEDELILIVEIANELGVELE